MDSMNSHPRARFTSSVAQLQATYSKVNVKCKIALNWLATLVTLPQEEELSTSSIQKIIAYKNTEANTLAKEKKKKEKSMQAKGRVH
eukprot:285835-Pelagomonas_calceolata.AAC.1